LEVRFDVCVVVG